ncbi:right-handed parallel beta-helix repeat-containing protein [Cyanobacteria bacterium FACHB-471]|nr:right-handed parallel beta-helix repeat-containing protein [Cyanobacteria bacterium FACHB-471]
MAIITVTSIANSGAGSLREAIANAQSGDTIKFSPTLAGQTITLTSGQLEINKGLTIDGSGATGVKISGNNTSRIFDVTISGSSFTLRNLTLINGRASGTGEAGAGGAIRTAGGGQLIVENSTFQNNASSGEGGGAIWAGYNSTNTILNSTFNGNDGTSGQGERGGGAISVKSKSSLTVKNSQFTNNKGTNGGAINSLLSGLTVENSTFLNNDSTAGGPLGPHTKGYGGAIYTDGANASGPNATPGSQGGLITIRSSRFESNTGAGQGGGLFLFAYPPDKVIVENTIITKNKVVEDAKGDALGGGLRLGNAEFTIKNTTFTNNQALDQGGGLWVGEKSPGTIIDSTFSGNRAESADQKEGLGGAITLANGSNPVDIVNTLVSDNYAGFQGGGFWGGGSSTTVKDSVFVDNVANNGGNNWNIKNHTGTQFGDRGGNIQWPPKNPNDSTDVNVTANVRLVDPAPNDLRDVGSNIPVVGNPVPSIPDPGSTPPLPNTPSLIARADSATTRQNTPVRINLLENDSLPNDRPFTLNIANRPTRGRIQINNNGTPQNTSDDFVLYTPKKNITGRDSFTYQINTGNGTSATAVARVAIAPQSPTQPPTAPSQPSSSPTPLRTLRYEAEQLSLNNYKVESLDNSQASAKRYISLRSTGETSGSANGVFRGAAGTYQVRVGYYDENDGQSSATVTVAGQRKNFKLDKDLFSDSAMHDAKAVVTTHSSVALKTGDRIEISARLDKGEFARFDYIQFTPVKQRPTGTGKSTTNARTMPKNADVLRGGEGNDFLDGGRGNDVLVGAETRSSTPGRNERDILIGGKGADRFQLGDQSHVFYNDGKANDPGLRDYALIKDFNLSQGDRIYLHGEADDYRIGAAPSTNSRGLGIYHTGDGQQELIAVIENQQSLNLRSHNLRFV